jgi:glycerophosphoryl diester phosphodiesterase
VPRSNDPAERARIIASAAPNQLIPTSATTYRRWVNFSWAVVEQGGQAAAGEWTSAEQQRLEAIVSYAHQQGLLVRFYTLNGHAPAAGKGWSAGYNFGSLEAVQPRWRGAIKAGVDLIATDQYEELAALIRSLSTAGAGQQR